jgi:serine/threonine protein kinase
MLAMELEPEHENTQPTPSGKTRTFEEWLDQLSAGECGWETVFRGVLDSLTTNPESGWELVALVDQYYRRHRISVEDFQGLNTQVKTLLMGGGSRSSQAPAPPTVRGPERRTAAAAQAAPYTAAHTVALAVAPPATPLGPEPVVGPEPAASAPASASPPRAAAPGAKSKEADNAQVSRPRTLVVNEVLRNRYRIRGVLGHGGMGTVYAAIDEFRLDDADGGQEVAIKALHTEVVKRPKLLAELRSEFQRLQSLSHPNIVRVHEFDRDGDLTFFTMEQLSGAPLSRVLTNHTNSPLHRPYALAIIQQAGGAVAYAHMRGIVHGDLNPGNIFITDEGEIRVLDFGASYRLYREPTIPDLDDLTRTAVATPSYASCEVLQGGPANAHDDIYAMSCISYALLTGKHPFQGQNALQARAARLSPRRPPGLNHRQWAALRTGLHFDRHQRPGDMQAWLDQLTTQPEPVQLPPLPTILNPGPPRRSRSGWMTAAIITAAAALCWWSFDNSDEVKRAIASVGAATSSLLNPEHTDTANPTPLTVRAAPLASSSAPVPPPPLPAKPSRAAAGAGAVQSPIATAEASPAAEQTATPQTPAVASPGPGHAKIQLAADQVEVDPLQSVASVVVQRRDSYRNDVSFTWWTESGTAKPGQDFVPVRSRIEFIPAGDREARLLVPIVADPRRHATKSFYVVIDEPSDGARLGSRTLTQVTIPGS